VVCALDPVVGKGICGHDSEQVADTGIIVDREGLPIQLLTIDLELPSPAGEIVFIWLTWEQNPDTAIGIYAEDCDEGVLIELEVHPDTLAAGIDGGVTPLRGQLDSGSVNDGVPGCSDRR
jgi:hypothetical protein